MYKDERRVTKIMIEPKISVIIPVYNVEQYLKKCIDSVFRQTFTEFEIIAVNDGSMDTSLEILESYSDTRIQVITQENQGLSGARNSGIKAAKGKYLIFLDSDDYLEKNALEELYKRAEHTDASIVVFRYQQVNDEGEILYTSGVTDTFSKDQHFRRILSAQSSSMACDKMYKRSLWTEHGIVFPAKLYHEDVATVYKVFYYAKEINVIEEPFYKWLKRDGSISKSISEKHIFDVEKILESTKEFLLENKIFHTYEKEYVRRSLHFLFGLTDRINESKVSVDEKKVLRQKVWLVIKKLELNEQRTLVKLKQIDSRLYVKLKLKMKHGSKEYKMLRKVADKILPKDSKRRELAKRLLFGKKNSNQDSIVSDNGKPMLNVAKAIDKDEVKKLKTLKDRFKGERCFIVGNGPSLNKCDLSLLENEYTFAVNGIFYKTEEMGFKPTFYMVEDGHVVDDNLEKINEYDPEYKFFPSLYKDKINTTENTYFFAADLGFYRGDHPSFEKPRFSKNFSEVGYCGQSVTYLNMQLAYYLGFTEVYLIGMDFSYEIRETDEVRGQTLISNEDDVNHFHPDYFGKGKKWHDPKVHNVAINYEFAKRSFEKSGRNIYNATVGGKLEIFGRVDYEALFNKKVKAL